MCSKGSGVKGSSVTVCPNGWRVDKQKKAQIDLCALLSGEYNVSTAVPHLSRGIPREYDLFEFAILVVGREVHPTRH